MSHSTDRRFVLCNSNDEYPASLVKGRIYEALIDADAEKRHQIRVVEESGRDSLYPETCFSPITLRNGR